MKVKKRYLIGGVFAVLVLARCTQMKLEQSDMEANGFSDKYEMQSITELGFKTKSEYDEFIKGDPINSDEAKALVKCSAISSVWESRELSAASALKDLEPATISSVLDSALGSYAAGKTTYKVIADRRDFLKTTFESKLEKKGSAGLKAEYLACHAQYASFVLEKCGASGVCAVSGESAGSNWNFLIGNCVIDTDGVSECTEDSARRGDGAGSYTVFFDDRVEMYFFDPIEIPESSRSDSRTVIDNFSYTADEETKGVILEITTSTGCVVRSLFYRAQVSEAVFEKSLPSQGQCSENQRSINDMQLSIQEKNGPKKKMIVKMN
jgi:hypothetical protein